MTDATRMDRREWWKQAWKISLLADEVIEELWDISRRLERARGKE
jgi:hypothetical protein